MAVERPLASSGQDAKPESAARVFAASFVRHRMAMTGVVLIVLIALCCFGAGFIAPYSKGEVHLDVGAVQPNSDFWLGTDELGRDYLTEVLYAGRISLSIGISVALLATVVGTIVGILAGYGPSWLGNILMRFTDLFLVIPALVLLAVALQRFGQSASAIVLVLAGLSWTYIARVVRGEVLSLRESAYVDAARVLGASHLRIVLRHILPNLMAVVSVNVSLTVAVSIIAESTLSFLGFGVQPPSTSWGTMLSQASGYVGTEKVYLLYFPGVAIVLTVLAISFIGDGLRDALDPRKMQ